jgi:DNA-binding phage protein
MTDYKTDLLTDLADPAYAALYVSTARKESPEEFLLAIRDVAECRAMSNVAESVQLNHQRGRRKNKR